MIGMSADFRSVLEYRVTMHRQNRNSILCPNCRGLISIDEERCPHCGLGNPGSRWKNISFGRGLLGADRIITNIISVNVGMFILSILMNPGSIGFSANPLGFLSPGTKTLVLLGATGTIPIDEFHRWWSVLSANYLHGSILHILFNMIALWQIGPLVVQEYGAYRMFSIFTLSGVGGFLASYLAGVPLTIGASAAICGLIGATLYFGKSRGGLYGQTVYRQVVGWVIAIFGFGFLVPGINNWAHGGGILCGVLTGFLLGYQEREQENFYHKLLGVICVLATLGVLTWAVGRSFVILLYGRLS
jgi:membrane associated rhomboid family serine protease